MLILSRDENVDQVMISLQMKMDKIYNWCLLNRLTINEGKTKYMVISSNEIKIYHSIGNQTIGKVKQYEYLGMSFEERLNMDNQIECTYKKANKKRWILSRIGIFISLKTASKI